VMKQLTRRTAIIYTVAAFLCYTSARAEPSLEDTDKPFGWLKGRFEGRPYYKRGTSARTVVLIHEINGLSPGCIDLGVQLADAGFTVFMPLLFGHPSQNSTILGGVESCVLGQFHCLADGAKSLNTVPVEWTRSFVKAIEKQDEIRAIGVIGMCQSGAFPLAVMNKGSKVRGVVLSQPAIPFGKSRQKNVGIAKSTMRAAKESEIPILALRFNADTICTADRFEYLKHYFGSEQFQDHAFDCPGFHHSMSHMLHAVLTGPCRTVREEARTQVIRFLSDKLG
jgi:dienelactone hydrolase